MKFARPAALMVALAALAGGTVAQETKPKAAPKAEEKKAAPKAEEKKAAPKAEEKKPATKAEEKKAAPKAEEAKVGTFELYKDAGGKFRFRLKDGDKQIAMSHVGYPAKEDAVAAIEKIKALAAKAKIVEEKE